MRKHDCQDGFALIETIVVAAFVAVSTLGLTAAMVSGTSLESRSHQTMASVATAENLMAKMRAGAETGFNTLNTTYNGTKVAASTSIGFSKDDLRSIRVSVPLSESQVPGGIDLNANGKVDTGTVADARLLVIDLSGANKLSLRSAVYNLQNLPGILLKRPVGDDSNRPVVYGETRAGGPVPVTNVPPVFSPTPPPTDQPPPAVPLPPPPTQNPKVSPVTVQAAAFVGKGAQVVLANNTAGKRTPTSITLVPDKNTLYAGDVSLNGTLLHALDKAQTPGPLTIKLSTKLSLPPGEATLTIGDFQRLKKGRFKKKGPKTLTVTVAFDDGSVASTVISK